MIWRQFRNKSIPIKKNLRFLLIFMTQLVLLTSLFRTFAFHFSTHCCELKYFIGFSYYFMTKSPLKMEEFSASTTTTSSTNFHKSSILTLREQNTQLNLFTLNKYFPVNTGNAYQQLYIH